MKALLIRVAVDMTGTERKEPFWTAFRPAYPNGGFRGPVWKDGRFEYIPVPEIKTNGKKAKDYLKSDNDEPTYGNSQGDRLTVLLTKWIPKSKRISFENIAIHHDPDFKECTYGDVYTSKGQQCAKLGPGDLIVFCASLNYVDKEDDHGLFIIGYFTVKEVHPFRDKKFRNRSWREKIVTRYWDKNAHFSKSFARGWKWEPREEMRSWYLKKKEDNLILVIGKDSGRCSGLLKKAIPITERCNRKYFYVKKDLSKRLGLGRQPNYKHLFERGARLIENEECIKELRKLLKKGGGFHQPVA